MTTREAHCACGQLRIACSGEPASVSLCHCRDCQRRTGSAYGVAAFFARGEIALYILSRLALFAASSTALPGANAT